MDFFKEAHLEHDQIENLANLVNDETFRPCKKVIFQNLKNTEAALYIVHEGCAQLSGKRNEIVKPGGCFGEEMLLLDAKSPGTPNKTTTSTTMAKYTATAMGECIVGVLTLSDCRKIFDTRTLLDSAGIEEPVIEPVIEPVKKIVKQTVKQTVRQQPIRTPTKKPAEEGKCSGKEEEGEADQDNRRARLKATKSDLHTFRRKLEATKSGIVRKTEEVRAPLIATTGEFKPPVFLKDDFEEQLIRKALKRNFVFGDLDDEALTTFIDAFEAIEVRKGEKIIKQGDQGDYFYVIARGKVSFGVNGVLVGTATEGKSFGELALLYTCPRAATVMASAEPTKLFRVDQTTFRHIMESKAKQMQELKLSLLRGVSFLKDLVESDLKRLSSVMFPRIFDTGEVIIKKGDVGEAFYILYEGSVKMTEISIGNTTYEDFTLASGDYFGELSLVTSAGRAANATALSKGTAFSIDRETFEKILGKFSRVILKAQDRQRLVSVVWKTSVVCLEKVL
jgi:cAMP-dependent protein kinase regulator